MASDGPVQPDAEARNGVRWSRALATTEGKVFIAGVLLGLLYLAAVALTLRSSADLFHKLLAMTGSHVIGGRFAGLSVGYSYGLPAWTVIGANIVIETVMVLLFYPVFVLCYRKLIVVGPINDAMARAQRAAEAQQGRILKYGIPMLLLFVWFPMWLTGPLVGAVIGFLIGLRPLVNLGVVLAGTYLAILCWSIFLQRLYAALKALGPYPPVVFVAAVLVIAVSMLVRRVVAVHNHPPERKPDP